MPARAPSKITAHKLAVAIVGLWTGTVLSLAYAQETPCVECHDASTETAGFAESVHAVLGCVDCHSGADTVPHPDSVRDVDCSTCHDTTVAEYKSSVHGMRRDGGDDGAPACATCHGPIHAVRPAADERSPVHPLHLAATCGQCHADPAIVEKYGIPVAKPIEAYNDSVHARANRAGLGGATCSSCHGSHAIQRSSDPRSSVFHARVPETCGHCHGEIEKAYRASVHGRAAEHGAREAPVCTDCHGEHRILSPQSERSPVYATNVPKMTCGRCHGDLRLAEKYDISTASVPAYEDSYHGLACSSGQASPWPAAARATACTTSCPRATPRRTCTRTTWPRRCGACHPGAGTRFAIGTVHVDPTERAHTAVYWVRQFYLWIIFVTIGSMVLHNLLDLYRKARHRPVARPAGGPRRERMRLGFRVAHSALAVSFIVLAWSGFALTYPESVWAAPLVRFESAFRPARLAPSWRSDRAARRARVPHRAPARRPAGPGLHRRHAPGAPRHRRAARAPALVLRTPARSPAEPDAGLSGEGRVHRAPVGHRGDGGHRLRAVVRELHAALASRSGSATWRR